MMHKAQAAPLLAALLLSCTGGGEASIRVDTRAIQALRSGLDPTTGELEVSCRDGRSLTVPVSVDDTSKPIAISVPACGPARIDFGILSTTGVLELSGGADTVLRPGNVDVAIDVRYVGQLVVALDAGATVDTCVATVERLTPDPQVVQTDLTLTKTPATLVLPIGSYRVSCDERVLDTLVNPGLVTTGVLAEPIPGPRLASTTLQDAYPTLTTRIDVTFVFTVPVRGVDFGSIIPSGNASLISVNGTGTTWTAGIGGLDVGASYIITLTSGIVDLDGLPLVGAPLALPFRVRANEYYVATTGDDSLNDGSSPTLAWLTLDNAVSQVTPPALIMIAAGDYDETISMPSSTTLEGGWAPDFSVRDVGTHVSRIRAGDQPVYFGSGSDASAVDGMWIEGTAATFVVLFQNSSGRVANSVIVGSDGGTGVGYGVFIEGTALPTLVNNVIDIAGGSTSTRVVHLQNGAGARLLHNTFLGRGSFATDVYIEVNAADVSLVNNLFLGEQVAGATRRGLWAVRAPTTLLNNAFAAEIANPYFDGSANVPIGNGNFGNTSGHYSGNAEVSTPTASLVASADDRTVDATLLNIGVDSTSAACGTVAAPYTCGGLTTDRLGASRSVPTTVGAYELP